MSADLPEDFFHALVARMDTADVLAMRQIKNSSIIAIAEHELRLRQFKLHPSNFAGADDLHDHLKTIAPFVSKIAVNFDDDSRRTPSWYLEAIMPFLNRCPLLKHVELAQFPHWHKADERPFVADFSRVRTLRISGPNTTENLLIEILKSCTAGVLREFYLNRISVTGQCLKYIPGQLDTLHLHQSASDWSFDWTNLVDFLHTSPALKTLSICQGYCIKILNVKPICPNLQHVTDLRLHINEGRFLSGWAGIASIVGLERLDVQVDGHNFAEYLLNLTDEHKLRTLRLELTNFDFKVPALDGLKRLLWLNSLEISIGRHVGGLNTMIAAVRRMYKLRRLHLYTASTYYATTYRFSALQVHQNMQHIRDLHISLSPKHLIRLSTMKQLRSLRLNIDIRCSSDAHRENSYMQDAQRLLRALCENNHLQELRIESIAGGRTIDLNTDIFREFGKFSRLHSLDVVFAMSADDLRQLRDAASHVKVFRQVVDPGEGCWDDDAQL